MKSSEIEFTQEDVVYSKIGAALVSAQRFQEIDGQSIDIFDA